jgi:hypothetical protein
MYSNRLASQAPSDDGVSNKMTEINLYDIITKQQDPELAVSLKRFVDRLLPEFKQILSEHPLHNPSEGCMSVAEAFWLYGLVRSLDLQLIIESGSFEGFSLYFLYIISFDPFTKPKVIYPGVEYCSQDWMQRLFDVSLGDKTLIFFDDHLHHGKRLLQASKRRIRHLMFHDNYVSSVQVTFLFVTAIYWV